MKLRHSRSVTIAGMAGIAALTSAAFAEDWRTHREPRRANHGWGHHPKTNVQLGPRPYFLVDAMEEGTLKELLNACSEQPSVVSDFSIGHRGAPLQFPEHTKESYEAAARMGAGIIECDVTFTADQELVCRHSQCDLHTTTNILAIPELAAKCSEGFTPADPLTQTPASARCCTSDITVDEFKTLCGKMDAANLNATTVEEYLNGTANYRTDLYSSCGTVMTHAESIERIQNLGRKFTPELKAPEVPMPFQGTLTQQMYAQKMIDEYRAAGIAPRDVWPQSFNLDDVLYWIEKTPRYGRQAVYLDARVDESEGMAVAISSMRSLAKRGVRIIAPPTFALVTLDEAGAIVPSAYAVAARQAGLDLITWTLERSGPLATGGGYYYQSVRDVIDDDGDVFKVLDVLAKDVGVIGVFSDWPATTTYYANCMGL